MNDEWISNHLLSNVGKVDNEWNKVLHKMLIFCVKNLEYIQRLRQLT